MEDQRNYGFLLAIISVILILLWWVIYVNIYQLDINQPQLYWYTAQVTLLKSLIPNFINTLLAYVVIYGFLTIRNIGLQRILDVIKNSPPRKKLISQIQKKLSNLEKQDYKVTRLLDDSSLQPLIYQMIINSIDYSFTLPEHNQKLIIHMSEIISNLNLSNLDSNSNSSPQPLIDQMIENSINYSFKLSEYNQKLIIHMSEIISNLDSNLAGEILRIEELIAKKDSNIAKVLDDEEKYIQGLVAQRNKNVRRNSSIHILYATPLTLRYYVHGNGKAWIDKEHSLCSIEESS